LLLLNNLPAHDIQLCPAEELAVDTGRIFGIFFGLMLLVTFVCWVLVSRFYRQYRPTSQDEIGNRTKTQKIVEIGLRNLDIGGTAFKITIGYYQVIAGMAIGLEVSVCVCYRLLCAMG
jgi:hypothetical protein